MQGKCELKIQKVKGKDKLMTMKILFIQPGLENMENCFPPIGLLYLASVARKHGYDVDIYDAAARGLSMSKALEYVIDNKPDVYAVSLYTIGLIETLKFIKQVKHSLPSCICIVGGPHATALPEYSMKECEPIDYLIFGEGEQTLVELLYSIQNQSDPSEIRGICYRRNGEVIKNEARPLISNLDEIPFPAYDLIEKHRYEYYRRILTLRKKVGSIITSRGCPFECTFCFKATFGRSYRRRSPQNVVREMKWLMDEFGIEEFHFLDDIFTLKRDWLYEFFSELDKNHIEVPWRCLTRADSLKEEDFIKMKQHGCYQVEIGIESGNDQVLKDIRKHITTIQVEKVFRWTRKAGLTTLAFFIFGHRLDTHKTIKQTLSFVKKISPDVCGFAVLLPFPGTKIYDSFLSEEIKYDWRRFHGYYDKNKLPLSICSLSAQELQQFCQQSDAEVYGRIGFLLRNILFRRGINYFQRKELFFRWLEFTKILMAYDHRKDRVFLQKSSFANIYYLVHFVFLGSITVFVSGLVSIFKAGKYLLQYSK